MNSDNVWTDDSTPDDHGVYRDYTWVRGDGSFVKLLLGIKNHVVLKDTRRYDLEIVDPLTHSRTTASGSSVRVEPQSVDEKQLGGLLVFGKRAA